MRPVGTEAGHAVDAIVGSEEDTKLIRVRLGGAYYYYVCEPAEDPRAIIPILCRRENTKAEQIGVVGPNGHLRPDSVREISV